MKKQHQKTLVSIGEEKRQQQRLRTAVEQTLEAMAARNRAAHPKAAGAPGACIAFLLEEVRGMAEQWARGRG